jgi:hypothetical protein
MHLVCLDESDDVLFVHVGEGALLKGRRPCMMKTSSENHIGDNRHSKRNGQRVGVLFEKATQTTLGGISKYTYPCYCPTISLRPATNDHLVIELLIVGPSRFEK